MRRRVLVFPSEEALSVALTSELVPASVQSGKVSYWTDDSGVVFVRTNRKLTRPVLETLHAAGVDSRTEDVPKHAKRARVWPQMIAPKRSTEEPSTVGHTVLFYIDDSATRTLVDLAGELMRLGCDRVAYQLLVPGHESVAGSVPGSISGPIAVLRAFDPPYYTVAAAEDPDKAGYRVFVPVRSGDTRTFIEFGWHHLLAKGLTPPDGHVGLIAGDGAWIDVPDGPWSDVLDLIDISLPAPTRDLTPIRPPRRLEIKLHLTPATRTEAPSMWVIHGRHTPTSVGDGLAGADTSNTASAIDDIDSLVSALPDEIIARLFFTVVSPAGNRPSQETSRQGPIVVLRARHGRAGPPSIDVPGVAMVPFFSLPNLFVPHKVTLEPPLRRDTVRDLLAPDPERVYWLAPLGDRSFQVESAPEYAFAPLSDWIEYLVDRSSEELTPWVRSVTFEFESFQSVGAEWAAGPPAPQVTEEPERIPGGRRTTSKAGERGATSAWGTLEGDGDGEESAEFAIEVPDANTPDLMAKSPPTHELSALESELAALERAFLDADVAADAPERNEMWLAMARLLLAMGRHRDAALCFARAVWERPRDAVDAVVMEWARAERMSLGINDPVALLWLPVVATNSHSSATPTAEDVRAVAVHWIASAFAGLAIEPLPDDQGQPMGRSKAIQLAQSWLDAHDSALDVRTLWLLRWSLAVHAGGDSLALARACDRILQSLRDGLSMERDVPTFLRFLSHHTGGDSVAAARSLDGLESLVGLLDRTPRKRRPTEAPVKLTRSYVWLVIAYGFARLGQGQRAKELRAQASEALDLNDPIHGYLVPLYSARIEQALRGQPPHAPLPAELAKALNDLADGGGSATLDRYRVDRLREASKLLEPQERIDAISEYVRRRRNQEPEELAAMRGVAGPELVREVERWLTAAIDPNTSMEDRARLLDGLMDHFPRLPSAHAIPALRTIVVAADAMPHELRIRLLQEALMLAGHFGRDALAHQIAQSIAELVAGLDTTTVEKLAEDLGACLRDLGRVGLRERVSQLRHVLADKLGGESIRELAARVDALAREDARKPSTESNGAVIAAVAALEARLHVATALAYLGHEEQAAPILEAIQEVLEKTDFRVVDHTLRLAHALARSLGQCSQDRALSGLRQLANILAKVTDSYNTNSHFCLSVIAFMEALVLGYAAGDLALGEFGRRFLDEDEYLVRRRIHREIGEIS